MLVKNMPLMVEVNFIPQDTGQNVDMSKLKAFSDSLGFYSKLSPYEKAF